MTAVGTVRVGIGVVTLFAAASVGAAKRGGTGGSAAVSNAEKSDARTDAKIDVNVGSYCAVASE
jgi:hypothetical protein